MKILSHNCHITWHKPNTPVKLFVQTKFVKTTNNFTGGSKEPFFLSWLPNANASHYENDSHSAPILSHPIYECQIMLQKFSNKFDFVSDMCRPGTVYTYTIKIAG